MEITDLFSSTQLSNFLLLLITICVVIVSAKLIQYLNHLISKASLEKNAALRKNLANVAKDLIVTAEKRFVEDPEKREGWVIDMLKFHFADEIKDKSDLNDDELLALVQKNYEEVKSKIPETRWKKIDKSKSL